MSITVYSKSNCPQCDATCRALDKHQIGYNKIDLTQDAQALAYVRSLGYQQAPVVVTGQEHWSGFRPDKIHALRAIAV
ncbi:glutaredoxin-like protein NrdH [Lonsdalea quercina]|uniref:Glutaredoxin-like protein NrdH n=1 Tax=Lonsdalea quercina TaxID=71657 RepID=A0A1H4ECK5_9GAMM|nr:glutaredoxin-like protein NrdH [Lonsdalea quercina]SEA82775.1 ribonucleoside-diphosphate reductase class Ib glutaredoxin subunit [Lonsdalea quercina]